MSSLDQTINACLKARAFFFKFISANDCGKTGAHQAGFYIPQNCWPLFLDAPGAKGENLDRLIQIKDSEGACQESRFIWYGRGTRSEYRLTRAFGLAPENAGDLLVLGRSRDSNYFFRILTGDETIENWLAGLGLDALSAGRLINPVKESSTAARAMVARWLSGESGDFPCGAEISEKARVWAMQKEEEQGAPNALLTPDEILMKFLELEFALFSEIERLRYTDVLQKGLASIENLIEFSNTILNRRKSRAGYSFENHLAYFFKQNRLPFSAQAVTENKKRPDFIFPSIDAYHDPDYPAKNLVFLAAKTTCKDRWRQIINEADRISHKYLVTLQQGMSFDQLAEMQDHGVRLVVPAPLQKTFPAPVRSQLLSLENFLDLAKKTILPGFPLFKPEVIDTDGVESSGNIEATNSAPLTFQPF